MCSGKRVACAAGSGLSQQQVSHPRLDPNCVRDFRIARKKKKKKKNGDDRTGKEGPVRLFRIFCLFWNGWPFARSRTKASRAFFLCASFVLHRTAILFFDRRDENDFDHAGTTAVVLRKMFFFLRVPRVLGQRTRVPLNRSNLSSQRVDPGRPCGGAGEAGAQPRGGSRQGGRGDGGHPSPHDGALSGEPQE